MGIRNILVFAIMVFIVVLLPLKVLSEERKTRIAVMDLKAERGIDEGLVKLLNELLLTEFVQTGKYDVIGGSDIKTIMEMEEKKRTMACDDVLCLSEIGGALGVDKLVFANIGKIGVHYLINVKIIDVRKARVVKRVSHQVRGVEDKLVNAIKISVGEVVGNARKSGHKESIQAITTLQRSEEGRSWKPGALPITLWSAGGAGIVTGIIFGSMAKKHEDNANNPDFVGAQLEIDKAKSDQLVANISYGVGAACVATGLLIWLLGDGDGNKHPTVAPVVVPDGVGLGLSVAY